MLQYLLLPHAVLLQSMLLQLLLLQLCLPQMKLLQHLLKSSDSYYCMCAIAYFWDVHACMTWRHQHLTANRLVKQFQLLWC